MFLNIDWKFGEIWNMWLRLEIELHFEKQPNLDMWSEIE